MSDARPYNAGDEIPGPSYWRLAVARARALAIKAVPPLHATPRNGRAELVYKPPERFTGLTQGAAVGGAYTVVEAQLGTSTGAWSPLPGGRTVQAYEYNLAADVAPRTAVEVRLTRFGDWRFELIREGFGATVPTCSWKGATTIAGTISFGAQTIPPGFQGSCGSWSAPTSFPAWQCTEAVTVATCFAGQTFSFSLQDDPGASQGIFTGYPKGDYWTVPQLVATATVVDSGVNPSCPRATTPVPGYLYCYLTCSGGATQFNFLIGSAVLTTLFSFGGAGLGLLGRTTPTTLAATFTASCLAFNLTGGPGGGWGGISSTAIPVTVTLTA